MRFQLKCSMGRMECYKRYAYHVGKHSRPTPRLTYREYFMEKAGVRSDGIYARVVDVSEIERVSAANE